MSQARTPAARIVVAALLTLGAWGVTEAAYNRVVVPIRWCVVQGSPAVANPGCSCQPNMPFVPIARGARASASYQNCTMLFRGAGMRLGGFSFPNVRSIQDPCDPATNPACAGQTGDIVVDLATGNLTEYFQAVNSCRQAWNQTGISAPGLIGVNVREFVDLTGAAAPVWGLGGVPFFNNATSQAVGGQFAVADDDFFLDYTNFPGRGNIANNQDAPMCLGNTIHPSTPPCVAEFINDGLDVLTAHEVGHSLSLGHLAQTAMAATGASAFPWMTAGGAGMNDLVCPAQPLPTPTSQCGQLRLQSICHQNGTVVDPPPVVDEVPFTIGDATPGWIDLELSGLIDDSNTGVAGLFWRVLDPLPQNATGLVYQFALDLDQNPGSGGDPATVGIAVPLAGAELVGGLTVDVVAGNPATQTALWRWEPAAMQFVPEAVLGATVQNGTVWVDDTGGTPVALPAHATLGMNFDANLVRGWPTTSFTARVRAEDPMSAGSDDPADVEIHMAEPQLSECQLSAPDALPGTPVTVSATGLAPNQPTFLWFDHGGAPRPLDQGMTDPAGNASFNFLVPDTADPGFHTVRILVNEPDHELSSVCSLHVPAPAGPPGESAVAGQLVVDAYDGASGELSVSYQPACEATNHVVHSGPLAQVSGYGWDETICDLGASGAAAFALGGGDRFFVIVGENGLTEGSYGADGLGADRPEATIVSACNRPQDLTSTCVP